MQSNNYTNTLSYSSRSIITLILYPKVPLINSIYYNYVDCACVNTLSCDIIDCHVIYYRLQV